MLRRPAGAPPDRSRRRFSYRHQLLPNDRLVEVESGVEDLDAAVKSSGLTMGYPAWNLLYYAALCSLVPQDGRDSLVVETGTNRGLSTIVLAQAMVDAGVPGLVHTVDIDADLVEVAKQNVARAGLTERVRFSTGDSLDFLHRFTESNDRVDFAFLDGSHEDEHVRAEFELLFPAVVAARGLVYFDNTTAGGVRHALRYIRHAYPGNLIEFGNCSWSPPGNSVWQPH